ncbi:unnamed protein product, partial [Phaeothamnion confervicola]
MLEWCVQIPSAADRLPSPWVLMARTPHVSVLLGAGVYVLFLAVWLPMYILSLAVTATGAWLALLGGVYVGGKELTRLLSYPGCSTTVQREMEREFTKNVSNRL